MYAMLLRLESASRTPVSMPSLPRNRLGRGASNAWKNAKQLAGAAKKRQKSTLAGDQY